MSNPAKAQQRISWSGLGLVSPALIWLVLFLFLPLATLIPGSLSDADGAWTIANYTRFLGDPFYLGILGDTLVWAALITLACLVLGFPVAVFLTRTSGRVRNYTILVLLAPLIISLVIRNYGWFIILGNNGWVAHTVKALGLGNGHILFTPFAVGLALVHASLAYMVIAIMGSLQKIHPNVILAAESLGAGWFRTYRKVILPLCFPGILAGSTIVFSLAASSFVTPEILGGSRVKFVGSLIYGEFTLTLDYHYGAAIGVILAVSTFVCLLVLARIMRRDR